MATVAYAKNAAATVGFPAKEFLKGVGVISAILDISKAASIKGSPIVAADVITLIGIPPKTLILGGCAEVLSSFTSASTVLSVGITGVSPGGLVATVDVSGGGVITAVNGWTLMTGSTATTIDVLMGTLSATPTGGQIRVDIVIADTHTGNTTVPTA